MAGNGYSERKEFILEAKENIQLRDDLAHEVDLLKTKLRKLNKGVLNEEKSIADEINTTIKKRRNEIQSAYDGRLSENRAKKRQVASKRDKKKEQRMGDRFDKETEHIRQNNRELQVELQRLVRQNRLPFFCGKRLYFIMFDARGMQEFLLKLVAFAVYFVAIPGGLTWMLKLLTMTGKKNVNVPFWCVLIASVLVIIQLLIYFSIYNKTKLGHQDVIAQARSIQDKINANKRQTAAIRSSIHKDKDESQYNLDAYDEKLASLDEEASSIGNDKQKALQTFEEETMTMITEEVNERRLPNLNEMKQQRDEAERELAAKEEQYSNQILMIAEKYATVLGEDMCRKDKLDMLIRIMDNGEATTVSEAIAVYKS